MGSLIGKNIERYEILEELGEGGMAVVYRANDSRLDRDVAIKVIRKGAFPADHIDRILKRFEREAKALARLSHPNIMKVHDYGEHEGSPYLVMEYLPGGTLKKKMGKPMPWEQAIQLILPIAEALDYAHSQNMIHRDVKPSNILLTQRGQPMLTDFGIAKILEVEEGQTLTGTGMGVGTPEYMSPEQWKGKSSPLSDIYSLGAVLYELLAGRKPYLADTPADLLLKQATEPLPRLSMFAKELPPNVEKILFKALERKPEDRYASMAQFASALEALLKGSPVPVPKRQMDDSQATFDQFEPQKPKAAKKQNRAQTLTDSGAKQGRKIQLPILLGLGAVGILFIGFIIGMASGGFSRLFPTPTPIFTATPIPLPIQITDDKGVTMRLVPAGEFTMGSNDGADDEKPPHEVYLDAYYMDVYEVTNTLYETCVTAGICSPPQSISSYTHDSYYGNSQYDDYPVINIDWNQANAYCEWRGDRLPTEAEWEKAARGTDERTYPWGDEFSCRNGNFDDETQLDDYVVPGGPDCDGYADTSPVGSYESGKSPYGIYDLAGNVWEWVSDWYDAYPGNTISDDDYGSTYIVLRGGSGVNVVNGARSAYRGDGTPDYVDSGVGFRCARSLP
ncbi:MAG: SUMF1/EgtB/PvdO family nonheme iron enzyme [Anaerolineales bacterium]|nr:SUMF1/EgtB/PvdO family nonheme iron enzyme [Anaerolineales bacterium]MCL4261425.1 SUMF1/EgtB/PvdO family nonheme iron enzyme [Anaerolineales bacterium]